MDRLSMTGGAARNGRAITDRLRCPERSEEYRDVQRKTVGDPMMRGERHEVETSQQVVLRDGEPRLKVRASCVCGWSASSIIGGSE